MSVRTVVVLVTGLGALAACEVDRSRGFTSSPALPTAVSCGDAAELKQRSLEDRRRGESTVAA